VLDSYYRHFRLYQCNFTKRVITVLQQKMPAGVESFALARPLCQAELVEDGGSTGDAAPEEGSRAVARRGSGEEGRPAVDSDSDSESEQGEEDEEGAADWISSGSGGSRGRGKTNSGKAGRGRGHACHAVGSAGAAIRAKRAGEIKQLQLQWEWKWTCNSETKWIPFVPDVASEIERAYQGRERETSQVFDAPVSLGGGVQRAFDFRRMVMSNEKSHRVIDIRRAESDDTKRRERESMRRAKRVCASIVPLAFSASLGALNSAQRAADAAQAAYRRRIMFSAGEWVMAVPSEQLDPDIHGICIL
jgi:hypothetical protein